MVDKLLEGFGDSFDDNEIDGTDIFAKDDDIEINKIKTKEEILVGIKEHIKIKAEAYSHHNYKTVTSNIDEPAAITDVFFENNVPYIKLFCHDNPNNKINGFVKITQFIITPDNGKLPDFINFDTICNDVKLKSFKTLKGFQNCRIEGDFDCSNNELKSLKYGPDHVFGMYNCSNNNLVNLKGAPITEYNYFICKNCSALTSLEGLKPITDLDYYDFEEIKYNRDYYGHFIYDFSGCPNIKSIEGLDKKFGEYTKIDDEVMKMLLSKQDEHQNKLASNIKLSNDFNKKNYPELKTSDECKELFNKLSKLSIPTPGHVGDVKLYFKPFNITVLFYADAIDRKDKRVDHQLNYRIFRTDNYKTDNVIGEVENNNKYKFLSSDPMDKAYKGNAIRKSVYDNIVSYLNIKQNEMYESFDNSFDDNEEDYTDVMNTNDLDTIYSKMIKRLDYYIDYLFDKGELYNRANLDAGYPYNLNRTINLSNRLRIKFTADGRDVLTAGGYTKGFKLKPILYYDYKKGNNADLGHPYKKIKDGKILKSFKLVDGFCTENYPREGNLVISEDKFKEMFKDIKDELKGIVYNRNLILESFNNSFDDDENDFTDVFDKNDQDAELKAKIKNGIDTYTISAGISNTSTKYIINSDNTITIPTGQKRPLLNHSAGPGIKIFPGYLEYGERLPDYIKFKECNGDFIICPSNRLTFSDIEGFPEVIHGSLIFGDCKQLTDMTQLYASYDIHADRLIIADTTLIKSYDDKTKNLNDNTVKLIRDLQKTSVKTDKLLDDGNLDPIIISTYMQQDGRLLLPY